MKYKTPFGIFTYRDVPSEVFACYTELKREGDYWYRIASPEKALCDKLYTMQPVRNTKELFAMLFDDLRIDINELQKLDHVVIEELSEKYHSTNIRKLCILFRRI